MAASGTDLQSSVQTNVPPGPSAKDAEFLSLARTRFKKAMDFYSETRQNELDDLRFAAGSPDNGWQWPSRIKNDRENDVNGPRPCLTINKLPQHIRQVTNDQRQNRPSIKCIPVDDEGDVEVADIMNGIIRHIEVNSDADIAYDTACENQVTIGEGYFRVLTEYTSDDSFDLELKIARIRNSFSVYMDPMIQDPAGADQQWCFVTQTMSLEEFEREYPKAQQSGWDEQGIGDDFMQWITDDTIRVAEYFCFESVEKKLYLWPNGLVTMEGDPVPPEMILYKPVKERTTIFRKVLWSKINGVEVLERMTWDGKYIPVIRVVGNEWEVNGKIVISGLVRNAKDPQRMLNYWTSQEAELLALAPRAPFIGAAGQFEGYETKWANANTTNYAYLEYNSISEEGQIVPPPQRVMPPMPSAGILNAKAGAADDIKATTGQYDASLGKQGNETSARAINARDAQAATGTFHYIDNLSRGLRQCGRILVDMIPKVYDTRRVARIIGEDGSTDTVTIDPDIESPTMETRQHEGAEIEKIYNPSIGRYDVVVTVGPGYNSRRQEALEAMNILVQANPALWQVIGDLLVKNMDWPGAQQMAERIKRTIPPEVLGEDGKSPELAQAMKMIDMLQQQGVEMRSIIDNIHKSVEYQKAENDRLKADSQAYDAETKRMVALGPMMTPEEIHRIVVSTVQGLMTSPDISQYHPQQNVEQGAEALQGV